MALQIKRGTNSHRLNYTPLVGELVFVEDYVSAACDPIYVGDGVTLGGVAVGQNAVLRGNVEGNIDLSGYEIFGIGDINLATEDGSRGDIESNRLRAKKITLTGDGGIAVVSTGSITNTGNVNVTGNISSSGRITAAVVESDVVGDVLSADSTSVLVNSSTNQFNGSSITLFNAATESTTVISGDKITFSDPSPFVNFQLGTEQSPFTFTQYEQQPWVHFGRIVTDGSGNLSLPNTHEYRTYRGTAANPDNIQEHDILGGQFYISFNNKVGVGGTAVEGQAGIFAFIAENQTGATPGIVPSTFVLGSGDSAINAFNTLLETSQPIPDNTDLLKYSSKGALNIKALNLRAIGNADRTALTPFVNEGTIIYNYQPTDADGIPLPGNQGCLQLYTNLGWYNIPLGSAANIV